jgi:hypothetical protein
MADHATGTDVRVAALPRVRADEPVARSATTRSALDPEPLQPRGHLLVLLRPTLAGVGHGESPPERVVSELSVASVQEVQDEDGHHEEPLVYSQ